MLGLAKADARGVWSFFTESLSDGIHRFAASATDADGNTSDVSAAVTVLIDKQRIRCTGNCVVLRLKLIMAGSADIDGSVLTLVASAETDSLTSKVTDTRSDTGAASGLLPVSHSAA